MKQVPRVPVAVDTDNPQPGRDPLLALTILAITLLGALVLTDDVEAAVIAVTTVAALRRP